MAIPKFDEFFSPILQYLNTACSPVARKTIIEDVKKSMNFTPEECLIRTSGDNAFKVNDRIEWSLTYLKQAELIENVARGIYQITEKGIQFLLDYPSFSLKELKKETPFLTNRKNKITLLNDDDINQNDETSEEQETVFDFVKALNDHSEIIQFSLLDKLISLGESNVDKGNQFEKICLELLLKVMKFDDGTIIGGSGDKGVDLILYVDIVKLTSVGVQCKCTKSTISAKDINHLRGGLEEHGLDKGIFITTSTFSKDAIERVKSINGTNTNIVLINGVKLAELMMEFEVGIAKTIHYSYSITLDESN